ncbi:restriction endonuclease subunit S [Amycolatopsis japonica]
MHVALLPDGWTRRRLLDIVTLPDGQVDPRSALYRDLTLIAPDHVEPGTGRLLARQTAAEQGAISGKYPIRPGDVVLSKIRPSLRKVVRSDLEGLCSADMYPLRPKWDIIPSYLCEVLLGEDFSTFAESVSGRSGIPKINRKELGDFYVLLPPVWEQRKISELLNSIDREIWAEERLETKRSFVESGLIDHFFDHGTLDQKAEWSNFALRDLLESHPQSGYSPAPVTEFSGVFMLGLGCLTPTGFAPSQLKFAPAGDFNLRTSMLNDGDLLLSRANTRHLVGMVGSYVDIGWPCIYPDLMMRLHPGKRVLSEFLEIALRSSSCRRQIQSRASGTSESMVKINSGVVMGLRVNIPDIAGQRRVLDVYKSFTEGKQKARKKIDKLKHFRRALSRNLLASGIARIQSE